jgi:hypothetical protein
MRAHLISIANFFILKEYIDYSKLAYLTTSVTKTNLNFYFCTNLQKNMEIIYGTWHWSISGFLIGVTMLVLTYFGKTFGMSSNLRTMCSMAGAGKFSDFFKLDWREQKWSLAVVLGAFVGGFIAYQFLSNGSGVQIHPDTIASLQTLGIDAPDGKLLPDALFSIETMQTPKGFTILLLGGLLIGFGTRYAGGCTSGHAIAGLSNLQLPSLVAVIGFFIGGLLMAHFLLPIILK